MIITEQITINAPLERVWQVFANIADWEKWNSVCRDCCFLSGAEIAPGACLAFTLRPYYLPIEIQPKVTKCVPRREVVWEGQRLGVHAVHRFAFQEKNGVFRSDTPVGGLLSRLSDCDPKKLRLFLRSTDPLSHFFSNFL